MIAEAKYLFQASNKRLMAGLLVIALIIGMAPIGRTQADEMGVKLSQSTYIDGAGGEQGIDVYQPGQGANHPGIIFVHGGGWRVGDKNQYAHLGNVAASRGFTAYSINYRLGASGVYYQYEDVMRAIASIRQNAAQFGTDPNRIAVWGDSAGGSLAMRVAASGETGLAAAVGWSAPVNAYTAIFNSIQSFAIGLNHSTCVPFDPANILQMVPQSSGGEGSNDQGTPVDEQSMMSMLGGNSASTGNSTSSATGTATSPATSGLADQAGNAISSATGGAVDAGTASTIANVATSLLSGATSGNQTGSQSSGSNTSSSTGSSDLSGLVNTGIQALTGAAKASGNQQVSDAADVAGQLLTTTGNNMNTPSIYDPKSSTASEAVKTAAARSPLAVMATHTAEAPVSAEVQRAVLAVTDALGCQDNFRVLSPALNFAKNTPPTFLANAESEYLVHPGQAIEYSNNLRAAGIDSEFLILPGANHMGYDERAVEPTFAFLTRHLNP